MNGPSQTEPLEPDRDRSQGVPPDSTRSEGWGDPNPDFARPPSGPPRWLFAVAAVALLLLGGLLAGPLLFPSPTPPKAPVDPMGFITPPDPDRDSPQREYTAESLAAAAAKGRFLGVDACRECHAERVEQYQKTHHFLSSRPASRESILGPLDGKGAEVATPNEQLRFTIAELDDGRFQQIATVQHDGETYQYGLPFDVVIGSGLHAQTFLTWRDSRLYQLPLTYSTELDQWVKSPGYPDGLAIFGRAASSGCLRCHATYLRELDDAWNSYDRDTAVWGISCEKCHGAGQAHIAYRRSDSPQLKSLEHDPIVRPAKLSRQRQLELCAQCHAGVGKLHQPAFSYRPGEPLDQFIEQQPLEDQQFGVHSTNQLARLRLSQCFQVDQRMTCTTCHNPHAREPSRITAAAKCLQCHQVEQCGKHERWGERLSDACIDCHMPTAYDLEADLASVDQITFPKMRDHRIARYPELSAEVEERWKQSPPAATGKNNASGDH